MEKHTSFTEGKILQPLIMFASPVLLALFLQAMYGAPIALQDLLVSVSFLIILAIVNSMGVIASAGVGVAERVCAFIMLISSAFMQSMSAFVAQNYGAGRMKRARKALHYGVAVSFAIGVLMFLITFFHGNVLAGIFASDVKVIRAATDYLKAYAIDCLFTSIFFCYTGFYNGIGRTRFVMIQGILGSIFVRVPVSYIMSIQPGTSLFYIGLATPVSSVLQLILCVGFMIALKKQGVLEDMGKMDMLSCGELCACKILEEFHITQPTLSHDMRLLVDAGLVNDRREGKNIYYSLNQKTIGELQRTLTDIFSESEDCICHNPSECKCD